MNLSGFSKRWSYNHNLAYLKPLDICKFNWLIHVTKTNTVDKTTNRMKMWMWYFFSYTIKTSVFFFCFFFFFFFLMQQLLSYQYPFEKYINGCFAISMPLSTYPCPCKWFIWTYSKQAVVRCSHLSRILWWYLRTVPMDRTSVLAMNSPTPLTVVLTLLPVLWVGENAVMAHASMSYGAMLQMKGVSLQYLNSVVTVWLCP